MNLRQCLNNRLAHLLQEEEIKWNQRAKLKELLEGDSNTMYFQLITNRKHRKTRIFQPQHGDKIIEGDHALKEYITMYYKDLFGKLEPNSFWVDESRVVGIMQVSEEENNLLVRPFIVDEVREVVFQMEHNKSPGPNGFPIELYLACWEIIKDHLMVLFIEFHNGDLPLICPKNKVL
jgi:hypothetical protein